MGKIINLIHAYHDCEYLLCGLQGTEKPPCVVV
jgi:hypothetical protein